MTRRKSKNESSLLKALRFVAVAQRANGSPEVIHCRIKNNWIVASNGIISAGAQVAEDIEAYPHTHNLIKALVECGESLQLAQISTESLSVRSGEFSGTVPCLASQTLPITNPDGANFAADDRLRTAIEIAGTLASESASDKVITSCLQLLNGSVLATNGTIIIEAWHSIEMPRMIVPKTFVTALHKIDKRIVRFGYCETSLTIWFGDQTWLKSQLYPALTELPDLLSVLNVQSNPVSVQGFAIGKIVCTSVDFTTYNDRALFFGGNLRGAIAKK